MPIWTSIWHTSIWHTYHTWSLLIPLAAGPWFGLVSMQRTPVSNRDRNFNRYRDSAGIEPFLPVPGLTGTGIGNKTESGDFWQVFITKLSEKIPVRNPGKKVKFCRYQDAGKTPNTGSYWDCHQDPGPILAHTVLHH